MNRLISAAAALMLLAGCTTKPEPLPPPTPQQTRMEIALLRSNADLARTMLDSGVNPNGTTRNGVPYLISAAARQDLVLTEILLEQLPEELQQEIIDMMWMPDEEALYDFLETYSS